MTREVRNALLAFVGAVLVLIVVDGTVLHYVRPGVAPLVAASGGVIAGLASFDVVRGGGCPDAAKEGHPAHGASRIAWLLLVPVLVVLLAAPPALGADAVELAGARRAVVGAPPEEPLPPGDAPPLALLDLVSRATANRDGALLAGRVVTLTGFVVASRSRAGIDLARLVISCCAADASPVRVHLDDPRALAGALTADHDRWISARVRLLPGTTAPGSDRVPTVTVLAAVDVGEPVPAYEY